MPTIRRAGVTLAAVTALGLVASPTVSATPADSTRTGADRTSSTSSADGYDRAALHQKIKAVRAKGATGLTMELASAKGTYRTSAGYSDIGPRTAAEPTDRYHAASVTKSMVATLVMKEIEAGNWTLDTRVHDVFPNLYPGGGDRTVRQLLSHRSGMPNHTEHMDQGNFWEKRWYDTRLISIAREKPFYFEGGAKARYSNTGYVTLGKMLERENDATLAGLLEWRIFKPAGMTRSRLSTSTRFAGRGLQEIATIDGKPTRLRVNPSIFSGSGGVESTTRDVNRFYTALFSGKLVPKSRVNQMITPQTTSGSLAGYGLGIYSVQTPCGVMYGHDGASFGTRNFAFSSQDGKTRVTIAWTGRSWDSAKEPPVNDLLIEAVGQTCDTTVGSDRRTPQGPVAPAPDIDAQHAPRG